MKIEQTPLTPEALTTILAGIKKNHSFEPVAKRGTPFTFSDLSFLMLAVAGVILRTFKSAELHRLLCKDDGLREVLGFVRVPHRTHLSRRLSSLIPVAEERIAELGRELLAETTADECAVSAVDGRMYEAVGPKWHKSSREEGVVPSGLRNVDTDSTWSKSAYRCWIKGFRLVTQCLVFPFPVPLAAAWRPNSMNEAAIVTEGLNAGLFHTTDVLLGDATFGAPGFVERYEPRRHPLGAVVQITSERVRFLETAFVRLPKGNRRTSVTARHAGRRSQTQHGQRLCPRRRG